jgi:predicted Zn-dependent peptidase
MYKKTILKNGIPVVMERTEGTRSVCIGIWVKAGSRNEDPAMNGISHFLEHMFFKGTQKRTARDIALEIDSLGGELNAFTSRECTTFYIKVLDEHIGRSIALLTDIFLHSIFSEDEINKEKEIIFDEINLTEDTPEDCIHDMFNKNIWGKNRLGQPVLGSKETIAAFTREDLLNYVENHYGTQSIIISCSGNFIENKLIDNLNLTFGALKRSSILRNNSSPEFLGTVNVNTKDLSEVHMCLGIEGIRYGSEDRYSMQILNTILGAGVSSRLFQEIREKRGLVYSIGSFNVSFVDTGVWAVYTGTDKKYVKQVVNIIIDQMKGLSESITSDELLKAKNQFKGNLVLALESTSSKMINIAKQELYYGRYYKPEEIINSVEAVTLEEVKNLSHRLVGHNNFAITVYGPAREEDFRC